MADWHVEFHVVPRRALSDSGATITRGAIPANLWVGHKFPADYQRQFGALASANAASGDDVQTWGTPDGNCIDAWMTHGKISAVIARIDVRKLDSRFGAALLQFVRIADAVLVRSDGLIIEPDIGAFAGALRNSTAWKFANDPAAHIAKYMRDDEADE